MYFWNVSKVASSKEYFSHVTWYRGLHHCLLEIHIKSHVINCTYNDICIVHTYNCTCIIHSGQIPCSHVTVLQLLHTITCMLLQPCYLIQRTMSLLLWDPHNVENVEKTWKILKHYNTSIHLTSWSLFFWKETWQSLRKHPVMGEELSWQWLWMSQDH